MLVQISCGGSKKAARTTATKPAHTSTEGGKRLAISQVTMNTFESKVLQQDRLVIVDFWTDWCGPCKTLAPIMEELAHDYKGKVVFYRMNAEKDNNLYTAIDYEVRGYPTLLYFRNGKNIDRQTGSILKEMIQQRIDNNLKRDPSGDTDIRQGIRNTPED